MTPAALQARALQVARLADRLGSVFAQELARVLRQTERRLGAYVVTVADGGRGDLVRGAQLAHVRREIRRALDQSGYDALVDVATADPLDQIAETVFAGRLARRSADLIGPIQVRLRGLQALQLADLLEEGDVLARALWKATVRGVFNSQPPARILDDLGAILDKSDAQIRTLYDTSVSIYGRQVEAVLATDDPGARFLYAGPDDALARPFCKARVGQVYTRAEIDRMDNHQLDNVFLTGGGYNCRHVWMELAASSAAAA